VGQRQVKTKLRSTLEDAEKGMEEGGCLGTVSVVTPDHIVGERAVEMMDGRDGNGLGRRLHPGHEVANCHEGAREGEEETAFGDGQQGNKRINANEQM